MLLLFTAKGTAHGNIKKKQFWRHCCSFGIIKCMPLGGHSGFVTKTEMSNPSYFSEIREN